ncbi:MAG: serine/threonine protein kinase [Sandaracinaceae bacterium]|nr:serine/threonine protein kinase [Sandaracinaceae bacterium]
MLRRLEKYEILEEIGHGGMATVYRARDTRLDRNVAVKVMHPHLRGAREARTRFTREAQTVARLRNPNILEIYDYSGEDSPESYIATELLTGPTLKLFAENHPDIPAEIAACFVIEITRALRAAHESGVIHRDIKPENVLLHEDRCIKLTDFGIAQMVDSQSMTATGQVLGSPGHMAPEQVEGKDCDARSDLFSLGTVLYFLATGKLPFPGRNPHQILKKIVDVDYIDPLRVRPSIGGRLRAIIVKLLERDPDQRYQTAEELDRDLTDFVAQIGIHDPAATLAEYLHDASRVSTTLRLRIIEACTNQGEKALKVRDLTAATDAFNRVLALDESNPKVLAMLERMGNRSRFERIAVIVSAVLVSTALVYAAYTWWPKGHARTGTNARLADNAQNDTRPMATDINAVLDAGREAAVLDASVAQVAVVGVSRNVTNRTGQVSSIAESGSRVVVFDPTPEGVTIAVDNASPRPFGPSFSQVTLSVGRHHFAFVGNDACCRDDSFDVNIPAGEGTFRLSRTLEFRPASVYVRSNVAGDVSINGTRLGRTREVLEVPLNRASDTVNVVVTAPGHRPYTGVLRLRAGRVDELDITLPAEIAQ